jgi:hypothetical protein
MKVFSQLLTLRLGLFTANLVSAGYGWGDDDPNDVNGSNFTYPYPVKVYKFTSQHQWLEMAHMDVPPSVGLR